MRIIMAKKITKIKKAAKSITHQIDAEGKVLGRLASEISNLLRGKDKATYLPYIDGGNGVVVKNASKIKLTGKKLVQKKYFHFSGYPGGLKTKKLSEIMVKNPSDALKRAVWNMLPKNKLRAKMIKRLKITN